MKRGSALLLACLMAVGLSTTAFVLYTSKSHSKKEAPVRWYLMPADGCLFHFQNSKGRRNFVKSSGALFAFREEQEESKW